MKQIHWRLLSVLFVLTFFAATAHAEIGRFQTKRERLAAQSAALSRRPASSSGTISPGRGSAPAYQTIHERFLNEDYAAVDRLSDEYLSRNPNANDKNDVLYLQALSLLKLDRADDARLRLRQLENSAVNRELKANASVSIADSYYYEGNRTRAYEAYKETMKKYGTSDQKDYVKERILELSSEFGYTSVEDNPKNFPLTSHLRQGSLEELPFYTVQVGSFAKQRNAEELIKKLVRRGHNAYLANDRSQGMNRVRVGRFSSKQQALKTEAELQREGYPTKIIP